MGIEYYFIPEPEIKQYNPDWTANTLTFNRNEGLCSWGLYEYVTDSLTLWNVKKLIGFKDVTKLSAHLVSGALACFRINFDGSPWQPANVHGPVGLRPCITPTCTWKLGPDETVCCWCGAKNKGGVNV